MGRSAGTVVRVSLATPEGLEAAALVPDDIFYRQALDIGDAATLSWPEHAVHRLVH